MGGILKMQIFTEEVKRLYTRLRIFEFNTGEVATDCLNIEFQDYKKWLGVVLGSTMSLQDDLLIELPPQAFNSLGEQFRGCISLALLCSYIKQNKLEAKFALNIVPTKPDNMKVIEDEIQKLEKLFNDIVSERGVSKFNSVT